ncbi:FMN-binding protein [Streptomyces malaysiense]|uniref:FMN-binding protein n=1 Tax=Streptomyces malaysiense TaxID=1428626 RepID=A0A1J4Q7C7_9ACTN|nr:FMN-binding protein [Streptomyces malaysiense]OIK28881.1 FMN-binding protein [Streptomyces malaysiense]
MHALRKNRPLRRVVLASATTVSAVVLLLSLKPHTSPSLALGASAQAPRGGASAPASSGASPAPGDSSAPGGAPATGGAAKTATGETVQTRWGPVQVRVTVKGGRLTEVTALQYPTENPRDQEINSYALPQLRREALAAQSAQIDMVSGATYTSTGYRQSLQSALDQVHG